MIFTVVIVSYNRDKKLKESIQKLLSTSLDEIVVVDNNSVASTKAILDDMSKLDARLKIIKLDKNKGASFGFATGLEFLENKYSLFVTTFLDDDAFFEQAFLDGLVSNYERIGIDASFLCPKVVNKNRLRLNMNRPMNFVPNSLGKCLKFLRERRRFGEVNCAVEAASFIGLTILNDSSFKISKLIPTDYFLYFDDLTFTYRLSAKMQQNGYYNEELVVIHDVEDVGREFDAFRLSYILRNSKKFNREIKGTLGVYPLLVHIYYFFVFVKEMKFDIFFRALFKGDDL